MRASSSLPSKRPGVSLCGPRHGRRPCTCQRAWPGLRRAPINAGEDRGERGEVHELAKMKNRGEGWFVALNMVDRGGLW